MALDHLLHRATKAHVYADPFPHLVLEDALDDETCLKLLAEYPSLETITQGKDPGSNKRFDYPVHQSIQERETTPLLKEMVLANSSQEFFSKFIELFGEHIVRTYPDFEERYGPLSALTSGRTGIDSFNDHPFLLDANIAINTPVVQTSTSVKIAHLDNPLKLYGGLFYLRHPDDDAQGSDLELYRVKKGKAVRFHGPRLVDKKYMEMVKTVPYKRNLLVMFLNSPAAFHGVTPRSVTPHTRYFINLIGEAKDPFFDLSDQYENFWRRQVRILVGR